MIWAIVFGLSLLVLSFLISWLLARKKIQLLRLELERKDTLLTQNRLINNQTELGELRQQLNPHLFKNALNSIQSHAYQTYFAMDKLSGVLDYVLYESNADQVALKDEILFAQNFIEINRLKLSPLFDLRVRCTIDTNDQAIQSLSILPLVTVDIIENAFKHTEFHVSQSFISIVLSLNERQFELTTSNYVGEKRIEGKEKSGIGLTNLKKRLELVYPNQFKLTQSEEGNTFTTHLTIQLHENA